MEILEVFFSFIFGFELKFMCDTISTLDKEINFLVFETDSKCVQQMFKPRFKGLVVAQLL